MRQKVTGREGILPSAEAVPLGAISLGDAAAAPAKSIPAVEPEARSAVGTESFSATSRSSWVGRHVRRLMIADAVVALVASVIALASRFGRSPEGLEAWYVLLSVGMPLLWVGSLHLGRCYERRFLTEGSEQFRRVFESAIRLFALLTVVVYASGWDMARGYTMVVIPVVALGSLVVHVIGRSSLRRAENAGVARSRVLIIGTERATAEMVRRLQGQGTTFEVVGALVDHSRSDVIEGVPVVGTAAAAHDVVERLGVDAVAVAAWSTLSQQDLRQFAWELEGSHIDVLVTPNLTDVARPRISVHAVGGLSLLHVEQPELTGTRRILKGAFDRGTALVALLLLWPVAAVIAVAVRLDSRGPALFRQTRIGRDGRPFSMLKFRSMVNDAEQQLIDLRDSNLHDVGPLFKLQEDPRVTRVGAYLRRTSLDELPQLWNILVGNMSLVGPRPPLPSEVEAYEAAAHRRLLVKPGLTGLWQVSGRSDLSWEESMRLDLYYVENWNLFFDLAILAKTVKAVVSKRGAY